MAIDITAKVKELAEKILADKDLLSNFKSNPIKVVEKLLGVDLPDEQVKLLVEGIKAKISGTDANSAASAVSGIANTISNLFGKKN